MKQRVQFLEKVKQKLLERRCEMMAVLETSSHDKVSDGQVQDTADEASSLSMERLQSSLEQTEIDEINSIDDALGRLTKGEYGFCVDCGQSIADKRLESFPFAARCIVCQEAVEEK